MTHSEESVWMTSACRTIILQMSKSPCFKHNIKKHEILCVKLHTKNMNAGIKYDSGIQRANARHCRSYDNKRKLRLGLEWEVCFQWPCSSVQAIFTIQVLRNTGVWMSGAAVFLCMYRILFYWCLVLSNPLNCSRTLNEFQLVFGDSLREQWVSDILLK